ncbi:MAG: hypothetical protein RIB46_21525 [Pseudomonadales bacterium]
MEGCTRRLTVVALLLAALGLAGCSGSSGSDSGGSDGVVDRPPSSPPPATPPPDGGNPQPGQAPAVTLSASDDVVGSGQSATLTWSSQNATGCTASGGWSGSRPVSGSASVGPINQSTTYSLTCTGSGGNAVAMISVRVLGVVTVSWQPPTENVDGSPVDDLSGYRIYLGNISRQYTDEVAVSDPGATNRSIELPSGAYYIAMTAVDAQGNESAYSNEIVRSVN